MIWNVIAKRNDVDEKLRHPASVTCVIQLLDGRVCSGGDNGKIMVWNLCKPEEKHKMLAGHGQVTCMCELTDGTI